MRSEAAHPQENIGSKIGGFRGSAQKQGGLLVTTALTASKGVNKSIRTYKVRPYVVARPDNKGADLRAATQGRPYVRSIFSRPLEFRPPEVKISLALVSVRQQQNLFLAE